MFFDIIYECIYSYFHYFLEYGLIEGCRFLLKFWVGVYLLSKNCDSSVVLIFLLRFLG